VRSHTGIGSCDPARAGGRDNFGSGRREAGAQRVDERLRGKRPVVTVEEQQRVAAEDRQGQSREHRMQALGNECPAFTRFGHRCDEPHETVDLTRDTVQLDGDSGVAQCAA
jgi:hypothetical protein